MHHRKGTHIMALILCVVVIFISFAPMAMAVSTATAVTTGNVNLRSGPGTNYSSLGMLTTGSLVTVLDSTSSSEWWKVTSNSKEGYVTSAYLKLTDNASTIVQQEPNATTTRATAIREGAGTSYKTLVSLKKGTHRTILDSTTDTKWWKATFNGTEGYIYATHVRLDKVAIAEAAVTTTAVASKDPLASKIASAKSINNDTVGWVQVPNTNIDEPILYGLNWFYATHNLYKQKSYDGVYPFYNRLTKNVVVFGHNMRGSNSIFHQLHHLQEAALGYGRCQSGQCGRSISSSLRDWYKSGEGRIWNVSIFGKQRWEVYAMYEVKADEPISTLRSNWSSLAGTGNNSVQSWIDKQIKRSQINFGVTVSATDQLMTLITCGTNYDSATANSRLFVFLKNVD